MAPTPQETVMGEREPPSPASKPLTGEEVVISGISGIFPKSNSVQEFKDNLFNKVDMVDATPRWDFNHPEVPPHLGKVDGMGKFDAQFFRVHYKQAIVMEPMSRKLLEHAYSAIFDSGLNPLQLRGRKVGVFIGSTFSESEKVVIYDNIQRHGFGITGCNKAMYANRISYWIDGKGPSYALDLACGSSMTCLENAYRSVSTGQCEAAIVGGCNLCMQPNVNLNLRRAGFLCLDGKTKCFDKNADGYVRSDAINVLFLQRAKDAKRIYAEVYYAKGSYCLEPDPNFLPIRKSDDIQHFLKDFYSDIDVSPEDVEFVEACGSALAEADREELDALGKFFAKKAPIKVGCVKSNMGHSEPASGTCSVTKVCIAYHKGQIPANLHYYEPMDDLPAIRDGRVEVLQEHADFKRSFVAVNCFSYSGTNIHVLLKGHYKEKNHDRYKTSIPRLVTASGRQEVGVQRILNVLKNKPIDPEEIGLLHSIHESEIPGHLSRGYTILDTNENNETVSLAESVSYFDGTFGPLWFVYSGMGSQWAGMGAELMKIPIFAAAIEKCRVALEPKGIDLVKIITEPDKTIYDNILHSFVGIAAVQIGLTDILTAMGLVPDNIIGHSVGELGCAYADGCFTAEEMILAAYSRGLVSVQTPFIKGSMAAIGLGYNEILPLCPPGIEVACHNSSDSSTISGPADQMKEFVGSLTEKGIFAKEVPCSNIAYHSKYIAGAGDGLLKYLSEVIKDPKPRSEKWKSTSVPQEKWEDTTAKFSSAEYHTNNLLNPVLFEETAKLIPDKAIMIEIAPHGLLQAILKRSHKDCVNIPLTRRGHSEPVKFLLEAIGKMYESGLNPKVDKIYPQIEFPVSTETSLMSHLVDWVHNEEWPQAKYNQTKVKITTAIRDFYVSMHDDDFKFLEAYKRNGVYTYPEAGILVLVWETLAMNKGKNYKQLPVMFRDVQFYFEAHMKFEKPSRFGICIQKGNYYFEVCFEEVKIVSGYILEYKSSDKALQRFDEEEIVEDDIVLTSEDIYKTLNLQGYNYKGEFQSLQSISAGGSKANIKWNDDWVSFLDAIIQYNILAKETDGVITPKIIKQLTINVETQTNAECFDVAGEKCMNAQFSKLLDLTRCGGVELDNIEFTSQAPVEEEANYLETRSFMPHFLTGNIDIHKALQINLQVVADNVEDKVVVTEFVGSAPTMSNYVKEVAEQIPTTEFDVNSVRVENIELDNLIGREHTIKKSDLFIVYDLLGDEKKMKNLHDILSINTFVLALEQDTTKIHPKYKLFNVITAMSVQKQIFILLKKAEVRKENVIYLPIAHDSKFNWVPRVLNELQKTRHVTLVSERQPLCGIIGMVQKLRKQYVNKISVIVVDDYHAPSFNPEHAVFKDQIQKSLTFNVLKQGQWGGYYSLTCPKSALVRNVKLAVSEPGNLNTLTWVEAPSQPASDYVVQVCYAAPSMRDTEKAAGTRKVDESDFGMDFSGIDRNGNKVMGLVNGGAIATTVKADLDLLWPVPEHWSLEDAATVPLPYTLAYYCLAVRMELPPSRRIFVVGGAGALGQAVISLCLNIGCKVYTAVSDIHKKRFLLKLFPQLKETDIGNSRDLSLSHMAAFCGDKTDIVINCVNGTYREAVMKVLDHFSIFLDLADEDMNANADFGMSFLAFEKNYVAVRLSSIFRPEYAHEKQILQRLVSEGIRTGAVRPITRVVYPPTELPRAFRLISSSRHRGRVLIRMTDPVIMSNGLNVEPKMVYSSKNTYVVVCDKEGLGLELADRLVKKGARNLAIHIKTNSVDGYFCTKVAKWRKAGISIKISSDNLQTEKGCVNLLKEATKLGPIEGLFIVQDANAIEKTLEQRNFVDNFNNRALVVNNLDLVSRNLCNELRYFALIIRSSESITDEFTTSVAEKICQSRSEMGLPALAFRVGSLKEFDQITEHSKTKPQSMTAAFKALETSLKLKYNNVISFDLKKDVHVDFLQKIVDVLGVKKMEDLDDNLNISDLRLNDINLKEISTIIQDTYDVFFPVDKLKKTTIRGIKTLKNNLNLQRTNFDCGLGAFYSYIEADECFATEPMITMPTKLRVDNTTTEVNEKEEEYDPKETYLMMIPGFEGHHLILMPICQRLKMQAQVLQLGPDLTNETIHEMAANILKFLKSRFELKTKFYVFGYSFGVNVALELAALIEKDGHVGVVYCLDSSPDALRVQLNAYLGNLTDTELQDAIILHMFRLMSGQDSPGLKEDLEKADTWEKKLDTCIKRLNELKLPYSIQYKRSVLEAAYNRIITARNYQPNFQLESEIVLMKGIPHPNSQKLPDDYNLSKYTKHPVKIFHLASDHVLAPKDSRVANVINKLFDPKLMEEFNDKNLCETYLTDAFKVF